jgi:hypothetical protein
MVKLLGLLAFSAVWAVSAYAQGLRDGVIIDPGHSVTEYRSNRDGSGGVFVSPGSSVQEYRYTPAPSYGDGGGVSRDYGRGYGGYGGVSR